MIVKDILLSARFGLEDAAASKYSDVEIIDSLNSVIRYTNAALINRRSSIARKKATLIPRNGVANLPEDFVSICDLDDDSLTPTSYTIVGSKVHTSTKMPIVYYHTFEPIANLEDTVPLPNYFQELLIRFTEAFVTKTIGKDVFPQIIYEEVSKLITGRDYPYITRDMPFTI